MRMLAALLAFAAFGCATTTTTKAPAGRVALVYETECRPGYDFNNLTIRQVRAGIHADTVAYSRGDVDDAAFDTVVVLTPLRVFNREPSYDITSRKPLYTWRHLIGYEVRRGGTVFHSGTMMLEVPDYGNYSTRSYSTRSYLQGLSKLLRDVRQ